MIIAWQLAGTSYLLLIVATSRRVWRSTPRVVRLSGVLARSGSVSSSAIFLWLERWLRNVPCVFFFHPRFDLLPISNALPAAFDFWTFDLRLDLPRSDLLWRFLNPRCDNDELLSVDSIEISAVTALADVRRNS